MSNKTSVSLSFKSNSQANRLKKPSASIVDSAPVDSSSQSYVTEFVAVEALPPSESNIKPIAPIPNDWPPCNPMDYGLNLRQPTAVVSGQDRGETLDLELRKFRENMEKLPEDTGMDEFTDVPIEVFGAALLAGYGWQEGRGIGRNAKEDVKVAEVRKKTGRGGLGFTGELPVSRI